MQSPPAASSPAAVVTTLAMDQPGLSTLESAPDAVPVLSADDGQMRPTEVFLDYIEAVEPALHVAGYRRWRDRTNPQRLPRLHYR